jgi:hypothetical protein
MLAASGKHVFAIFTAPFQVAIWMTLLVAKVGNKPSGCMKSLKCASPFVQRSLDALARVLTKRTGRPETFSCDYLASLSRIVSCGGDTDTNASLFGQIHGAAHGPSSIPSDLTRQIDTIPALGHLAIELTRLCMKLNHLL